MVSVLLGLMLSGLRPAIAQEGPDSDVLVAHGVLSRNGKAGTLWNLKQNDLVKFRDETIHEATFVTPAGEASQAYVPYDGKYVELVAEVESVFHGNAVLSKIRTIGLLDSPATSILSGFALAPGPAILDSQTSARISFQHAYYLFLAGVPHGCEACYVPLLITHESLDEIAQRKLPEHGVFIFTFERDSI